MHHLPGRQGVLRLARRALGAERLAVYEDDDGRVVHGELRIGASTFMAGDERAGSKATPPGASVVYVVVDDADAAYERAKAAGAEVTEPVDQDYGSRDVTVTDPGRQPLVARYLPRSRRASRLTTRGRARGDLERRATDRARAARDERAGLSRSSSVAREGEALRLGASLRRADFEALGANAPEGPILGARVEHLGAKEALLANDEGGLLHDDSLRRLPDHPRAPRSDSLGGLEEVIVEAWLVRAPKRLSEGLRDGLALRKATSAHGSGGRAR